MDRPKLSDRIFQRVDEMGLTNDLARYSGLDPKRLQAIRDGDKFSSTEFERICRAVAVDPVAMYRGEEARPQRIPARFRSATSQDRPSPSDIRMLALAAEQGRILAHLCNLLGTDIPITKHRHLRGIEGKGEIWREGYALGEEARNWLRHEPGPVYEVEQLLRDLGIHVARVPLSSPDLSAASIWEPDAVPVILLNASSTQNVHPGALRATLIHELCHLLHDAAEHDMTTRVSWGTKETGNYNDVIEMRARAFSPAFLAPRGQVEKWVNGQKMQLIENDVDLVQEFAFYWGLSFEGAGWHASNCKIIPSDRAEELAKMQKKPHISFDAFEAVRISVPPSMFHELLPEEPVPLWNGWAAEVVLSAFDEGCITAGRARELLTWD